MALLQDWVLWPQLLPLKKQVGSSYLLTCPRPSTVMPCSFSGSRQEAKLLKENTKNEANVSHEFQWYSLVEFLHSRDTQFLNPFLVDQNNQEVKMSFWNSIKAYFEAGDASSTALWVMKNRRFVPALSAECAKRVRECSECPGVQICGCMYTGCSDTP